MDVIGERWTLLILRELTYGPKRYKELLERLGGIGTNLLADRLKVLASAGIIRRRRLARPVRTVYELGDSGRDLLPALFALARWGSGRSARGRAGVRPALRWGIFALGTRYRGLDSSALVIELRFGRSVHTVRVDRGRFASSPGSAERSDVRLSGDLTAFLDVAYDRRSLDDVLEERLLAISGTRTAIRDFVTVFGLPRPRAA